MNFRALFQLGQFELVSVITVADMTTYFGRTGTEDNFKMVVAIEGEYNFLVMEDVTPKEMLAVITLQMLDEVEIDRLGHVWKTVQPLVDRIPEGYEMFRPVP